ncbi:MAG: hypothetical protein Q7S05_05140, partial [bacterium]|nr:hypothetical protein [bacterium]
MKLFLIWPTQAPEVNVLLNELTNAGHEIAYWVGEYPVAHLNPRGCVFHDHYDAWDGKPAAALKDVAFAPVSADLASKCFAVESAALSMMDKRYDSAPVSERKHIYYAMLSYWNGVLDRYKPDAVVFANIPHSVYNYILYELARARGLRTPCFEETWVASRFLMYEDFWNGSDELRTEIKRTLAHGAKESELGEELRAYWEEQTRPHSQAAPVYMANRRSTSEGWGLLKHRVRIAYKALLAGNLPSLVYGYIRRPGKKDLKKEYARVVREADWNTPFVYFPLHFQPERTTSPQGGVYNDQL